MSSKSPEESLADPMVLVDQRKTQETFHTLPQRQYYPNPTLSQAFTSCQEWVVCAYLARLVTLLPLGLLQWCTHGPSQAHPSPTRILNHAWTSARSEMEPLVMYSLPIGSCTSPSVALLVPTLMIEPGWHNLSLWVTAAISFWSLVSTVSGKLWYKVTSYLFSPSFYLFKVLNS